MMATQTPFQLPNDLILAPIFDSFPCREAQIRALTTLVYPYAAPCRNIVIHGVESTGKSAITTALLKSLSSRENQPDVASSIDHAIVSSVECVTARHLFEHTIFQVRKVLGVESTQRRCENLLQLTVELTKMLNGVQHTDFWRFVLVFDGIDRQREAPYTMLPALARLSEIIPCLTTIFIMTCPQPMCLREAATPHLHFPNYTKQELVSIVSKTQVPDTVPTTTDTETRELWPRFCGAVHDALIRSAARTLPSFSRACNNLWPRFTAPITAGNYGAKDFSRLLIAGRVHFQDERVLDPGVIRMKDDPARAANSQNTQIGLTVPGTPSKASGSLGRSAATPSRAATNTPSRRSAANTPSRNIGAPFATTPGRGYVMPNAKTTELTSLPTTARLLLLAAYLASHNQARHDATLFCTSYTGRKRRRGGMVGAGRKSKHKKIARKLLGAHAFVMERMLAIFAAVRTEWAPELGDGALDADFGVAVATLASLRLLVKVGAAGGDPLDRGGKWRVNVGWEVVRGVGRSIGVEVEEWLID
ncbi:Origin recognition complex subunit 5 [Zalerion maritima]|uniref:Origin recognition complex subunit 5 n=1 Tax=Zalerion maritima TaxID=339359 RepID=A0AAD5RLG2_9PEZI|nr:Origin recognition complex subunit 5 [Zalerion maritima]